MADGDVSIGKEIKGVPIWVYGAAVAAVIILYSYLRRASSSGTNVPVDTADSTPLDSSLNSFTQSGGAASSDSSPLTDQQWQTNALNFLEQQGYDPLTALQALETFLNGDDYSQAQGSLISKAIGAVGTPPDIINGLGSQIPTPVVAATPPKSTIPTTKPTPKPTPAPKPAPKGIPTQAQARAASPRLALIYKYYMMNESNPLWQTSYEAAYNLYVKGGEAVVPSLAAVQHNIQVHTPAPAPQNTITHK